MNKMKELFLESTIIQGILTLLLWGLTGYLVITEKPIPEILAVGDGAILTFWFKSKVEQSARNGG